MDLCISWITMAIGVAICGGQLCIEQGCTDEFGPDVDVEIVCGYGGSVVVMWSTADQYNVFYLQVEYSCGNNSGHSQTDVLVQNSDELNGARTIPGSWSDGTTCTVSGCYVPTCYGCPYCYPMMQQNCSIPPSTEASPAPSSAISQIKNSCTVSMHPSQISPSPTDATPVPTPTSGTGLIITSVAASTYTSQPSSSCPTDATTGPAPSSAISPIKNCSTASIHPSQTSLSPTDATAGTGLIITSIAASTYTSQPISDHPTDATRGPAPFSAISQIKNCSTASMHPSQTSLSPTDATAVPTPTSGTGLIITSFAASTYTSQPSSSRPTDATKGPAPSSAIRPIKNCSTASMHPSQTSPSPTDAAAGTGLIITSIAASTYTSQPISDHPTDATRGPAPSSTISQIKNCNTASMHPSQTSPSPTDATAVPTPTSGTGLIITSIAASTYTSQPSSNHPTDATRGPAPSSAISPIKNCSTASMHPSQTSPSPTDAAAVPTPTSGTGLIITSVAASTYTSQPSSNHPTDATRALATTLILVVTLITVLLGVVICALIAILMAYRRRKKRKDVHQLLAGLANVIQEIEMDLSPQRFDVKSVHSADIVYNNLDFSDERTPEGSIWSGLENILHDMEAVQIMCDFVDDSPLQTEAPSNSVLYTKVQSARE